MTFTSRLLGLTGNRAAAPATTSGNGRSPKGGTSSVWYSTPGQPQIPEWDGTAAIRNGYAASIYVMQPVRIIATALGSLPFRVGADPAKRNDYDTAAPMARLLGPPPHGPNPVTSPRNLWIWSIVQRLITGRMAWETVCPAGSNVPGALWPLVAPFLQPIPSKPGTARWFDGYIYQLPAGRTDFGVDDVFYSWRPSQTDWRQPESALQAANMPASLQIALDRYMWALAKNGLAAKKLVITPEFAEDDERRAWEEQFAAEYTGYDNGGRVMHGYYEDDDTQPTAGGSRTPPIQVVDLATSPADAQVLEILKTVKDDMLRTWRVPMSWMGDSSQRCLRQTEWVRLADGRRARARDLAGTSFRLLTATDTGQVIVDARAEWESTCEVFRVTTESGRTLEVNGNHPLYAGLYDTAKQHAARNACRKRSTVTPAGWTPVGRLLEDAPHGKWVVAVPTRFHQQHTPGVGLTEDEAFVVGALVGDGSISQPTLSPKLTTPDGPFVKEFIRAVEAIGDDVVRYQTGDRVATWATRGRQENRKGRGSKGCNQTRALLDRLGLIGTTSHTKFVPDEVFASSLPAQLAFLSGLFAADGSVSKHDATRAVTLSTVSRRLAADVQELLLRAGICSRIVAGSCTGGIGSTIGVRHSYFTVAVNATEDLARLCDILPIPGKQDRLDAVRDALPSAHARRNDWRRHGLMPNLRWERITSVESLGVDRTVGIQVPGHHTYLGTFFEHNTYENASQEAKNFWQGPVMEAAAEIADDVNMYLAPRFGDGKVGWFDFSGVEALRGGGIFAPVAADLAFKAGLIVREDWRNDVGLPPLEGDPPGEVESLPAIDDTPGGTSKANFTRAADSSTVDPDTVYDYLRESYPPSVLGWVHDATWTRARIPLDRVKLARRPGGRDMAKVEAITEAIQAGKQMDPVVLVDTGEDKLEIADGYHRALAFQRAGRATIDAYVGSGVGQHGPWEQAMHDAKLNRAADDDAVAALRAEIEELRQAISEGVRYDVSPLGPSMKPWIAKVGGLPLFIRAVAHALERSGHDESRAIEMAVGIVRNWAEGKGKVTPKTRAKAAAAIAEWEAKRVASHARSVRGNGYCPACEALRDVSRVEDADRVQPEPEQGRRAGEYLSRVHEGLPRCAAIPVGSDDDAVLHAHLAGSERGSSPVVPRAQTRAQTVAVGRLEASSSDAGGGIRSATTRAQEGHTAGAAVDPSGDRGTRRVDLRPMSRGHSEDNGRSADVDDGGSRGPVEPRGRGYAGEPSGGALRVQRGEGRADRIASHARDVAVTESGSAGLLLPKVGPPMPVMREVHLPTRGPVRGRCGRCGQPATAPIHRLPRSRRGTRHAGPDGHQAVPTGHATARRRTELAAVHRQADTVEPSMARAMAGVFAAQRKATLDRLNGRRGKQMIRAAKQPPEPPAGSTPPAPEGGQPAPVVDAGQVFDFAHWVAKTKAALDPVYAAIGSLTHDRLAAQFPADATAGTFGAVQDLLDARLTRLADTVTRTTFDEIARVLHEGVAQGQSVAEMTRAIEAVFDDAEKNRAPTIARTEALGAINHSAQVYAEAAGPDVISGREWLSAHDSRVRHTHRLADGQVRGVTEPYIVGGFPMMFPGDPAAPPGEVINCFPADTEVRAAWLQGGYRRAYTGAMVTVSTATGRILTGTPNHPVLTDKGWVPLCEIKQGSNLICASVGQGLADEGGRAALEPDVEDAPALIGEVVRSLEVSGERVGVSCLPVDFHGDGTESEIDVIRADRTLHVGVPASLAHLAGERDFTDGDVAEGRAVGDGTGLARAGGVAAAPAGLMRRSGPGAALFRRGIGEPHGQGIATVTGDDADGHQPSANDGARAAVAGGDALLGFAAEVSTDEVVDVTWDRAWSGHVYNLETATGTYVANGIVTHNCRCSQAFLTPSEYAKHTQPAAQAA